MHATDVLLAAVRRHSLAPDLLSLSSHYRQVNARRHVETLDTGRRSTRLEDGISDSEDVRLAPDPKQEAADKLRILALRDNPDVMDEL